MDYRGFLPLKIESFDLSDYHERGILFKELRSALGYDDYICVATPNMLLNTPVADFNPNSCPDAYVTKVVRTISRERTRKEKKDLCKELGSSGLELVIARDNLMHVYAYYILRMEKGDPLFDQYMVDAKNEALNTVLAMDRTMGAYLKGIDSTDPEYPQLDDHCYRVVESKGLDAL